MPYEVKGVVARSKGAPVTIETILVPDPGPGEAVVDVQACGVCHTDLHYREGGINDEFPFLLGHEAAGVVSAVGEGVTNVAVGDYVILNWRAVCGQCRACAKGKPWYCFNTHNAAQKMTLADGTELSPALGIGAFAEKTLVHSGQCTKVDPAAPPTAAGLLGCGVMAGVGAAINTGGVGRGDTVAVFGCGGVGDAAIAGSRLAGASTIIAVDIDDRKLEWARGMGATHTVNSQGHRPGARRSRRSPAASGWTSPSTPSGTRRSTEQAFDARDLAGTVVLVGVPNPTMTIELPLIEVFGRGGALKSSWYGDCLPSRDFPMLIDLYLQGRFDLDAFVSETIGLDDVEAAFEKMHHGEVLRSVVVFESDRPDRQGRRQRRLQPRRAGLRRRQQRLARRRRRRGARHRRPARRRADRRGDRRPAGDRRSCSPTGTTTTSPPRSALREATGAPIWFNPADRMLWDVVHPDAAPDDELAEGTRFDVAGTTLRRASARPGTRRAAPASTPPTSAPCSPATRCSAAARARPAARSATTRRSSSRSARRLLTLPGDTVVRTGHGDDTTIAAETSNVS